METDRRKTHITETDKKGRDRGREEVINTNNYYTQRRRNQMVWVAIALIVLIFLVLFLYNRNTTPTSPSQVQVNAPQTQDGDQTRGVEEIRTRLQEVNRKLSENGNFDEAAESVARIREDFRISFQSTGDDSGTSWQGVDDQLNTIELQLKEKSIDAGSAIDKLIEALKDFRIDIKEPSAQ